LLGLHQATHASEVKHRQAKVLAEQKKASDQIKKDAAVHSVAEEIMEKAAITAQTIVAMPKNGMEHHTSDLDAAMQAIEAMEQAKKTAVIVEPSKAIVEKIEAKAKAQLKKESEDSAEQRFAKYQAITSNPNATDEEKSWAATWARSNEGIVQLKIYKLENES
ncbi:MAG: hypothetical protein Q9M21_08410, partial [Mariprofundaceae bacterium]|nr:hypothetical protein [Mariprofundaceae bacterium]